eukprot:s693_g18.t1
MEVYLDLFLLPCEVASINNVLPEASPAKGSPGKGPPLTSKMDPLEMEQPSHGIALGMPVPVAHAKARKEFFHPCHESNPVDVHQLRARRLTVTFEMQENEWTHRARKRQLTGTAACVLDSKAKPKQRRPIACSPSSTRTPAEPVEPAEPETQELLTEAEEIWLEPHSWLDGVTWHDSGRAPVDYSQLLIVQFMRGAHRKPNGREMAVLKQEAAKKRDYKKAFLVDVSQSKQCPFRCR